MERYRIIKQLLQGEETYILIDHDTSSEVQLTPDIGNHIIRYIACGNSIILSPPDLKTLRSSSSKYGFPILFPPNRVKNAAFKFNDRQYLLPTNNGKDHIHGEINFLPWKVKSFGTSDEQGAYITSSIRFIDHPRLLEYYPHELLFELTYRLKKSQLFIEGKVTNEGVIEAPYALGFHPYFNIPFGQEEQVIISVSAIKEWDLEGDFVNGLSESVNYVIALQNGISFSALPSLGYQLFSLEKGTNYCEIIYPSKEIKLVYEIDKHFPFLAVFKPTWANAISFEPYTYLTDAFNLSWPWEITGAQELLGGNTSTFQCNLRIESIN